MKKRTLLYAMLFFLLILDSRTAIAGASEGLQLCIQTVIPSLFPFMFLSTLMTGSLQGASFAWLRPVCRLFHIPGKLQGILLIGFLGGYPAGAQAAVDFGVSRKESRNLLTFCSNAGPAFIFGMGANLFPERWMCWAAWLIHILSALLVARLFPVSQESISQPASDQMTLTRALRRAVQVMGLISGWVVLFRVVLHFCQKWFLWRFPLWIQILLCGLTEMSNGCVMLAGLDRIELRFILFSLFLAFGGLCVAMQTYAVTEGLDRSRYLPGKLLQAFFSLMLSSALFRPVMLGLSVLMITILFAKTKKGIAFRPSLLYNRANHFRRKLPCSFAKTSGPCAPTASTPRP